MLIEPIYDYAYEFSEGLCAVEKDNKWGFINKKGVVVIPFKFSSASSFYDGSCSVELINKKGETVEMELDKEGNILE